VQHLIEAKDPEEFSIAEICLIAATDAYRASDPELDDLTANAVRHDLRGERHRTSTDQAEPPMDE
jgi:hypothetical protein